MRMAPVGLMLPPTPLIAAPPRQNLAFCVTIPARDEARALPATIAALAHQHDYTGRPFSRSCYELLILANNCRDDTAAVARATARSYPNLAVHVIECHLNGALAGVGMARRLIMDEAYRRLLACGRPHGVIATTDADTCVAPTWLAALAVEFQRGADAVGGDIRTSPGDWPLLERPILWHHLADSCYQRLAVAYGTLLDPDPADPWPRHQHHTGASLALTAAWYERCGGMPALSSGEDIALVRALQAGGGHLRHSPLVRVTTSARRTGRAPGGMAVTLDGWASLPAEAHLVESKASIVARVRLRAQLRGLWGATVVHTRPPASALCRLAHQLTVAPDWLSEQLHAAASPLALCERVAHMCPPIKLAPIALVSDDLRRDLVRWRGWRDSYADRLHAVLSRQAAWERARRPTYPQLREKGVDNA